MAQPKARRRLARTAVAAALTGVMAFGGVLAPVGTAFAAEAIVTLRDQNGDTTDTNSNYKRALLVFKAEGVVTAANPEGALATGVTWNDNAKALLVGSDTAFLSKADTGASTTYLQWLKDEGKLRGANAAATKYSELGTEGKGIFDNPQNAARYIGEEILKSNNNGTAYYSSTSTPNKPNVTTSTSFANKLAEALKDLDASPDGATTANGRFNLGQAGYYLLTGGSEESDPEVAPIWLPFDPTNGNIDIFEKDKLPTFVKTQTKDSKQVRISDAGNGEEVSFVLTATLPHGKKYKKIQFTDELPEGLTLKTNASGNPIVTVKHDGTVADQSAITGAYISSYDSSTRVLTVKRDGDELDLSDVNDDGELTLTVEYTATVNDKAGTGQNGVNSNKATFTYDDDQQIETESESDVVTFGINLVKIDALTGDKVDGIKFTVKDSDDFVQADGTKDSNEYSFTTGEQNVTVGDETVNYEEGEFEVIRINASTYTFHEDPTTARAHDYEPIDDFTVTIKAEYDQEEGTLKSLTAQAKPVSGGPTATTKASVEADAATGMVTVTVPNGDEEIRLPLTGMTPSQLGTVAGLALVAASAYIIMRRRQAQQA